MSILSRTGVPAVTVERTTSVMRAIQLMEHGQVDTLFVVENEGLLGAFTQRDLAFRVVLQKLNPEITEVVSRIGVVPSDSRVHLREVSDVPFFT